MEKFSGWFRVILTWVVIVPDLILSYHALRNPYLSVEGTSLALNFVATTVLFYIYIDLGKGGEEYVEEEGETTKKETEEVKAPLHPLYTLGFGSLIEDMLVWLGLYFLLYNIVPVTLYVHNLIGTKI